MVSFDYADLKASSIKAILMKNIMVGNVPQTLQSKFQATPRETNKLQVPVDFCKFSLVNSGCVLWNTLPPTLRSKIALSCQKNKKTKDKNKQTTTTTKNKQTNNNNNKTKQTKKKNNPQTNPKMIKSFTKL